MPKNPSGHAASARKGHAVHGNALTDADRRGLTPLFWTHVLPYGEVHLDLGKRLSLRGTAAQPAGPAPAP